MAEAWKLLAGALDQPVEALPAPKRAEWVYATDLVQRRGQEGALLLYRRFLRRRPVWARDANRFDLLALKGSETEVLAAMREDASA